MPGRQFSSKSYRYGHNGKEKDEEVKGVGNFYNYGMRFYDARIGRPISVDPIASQYPWLSPYQFYSNNPIALIDIDGLEGGAARPSFKPRLRTINYRRNRQMFPPLGVASRYVVKAAASCRIRKHSDYLKHYQM
jgi:RHS repeat-associated protein